MIKRVFLIVLDSVGIGALPDAAAFGDAGSHTLKSCFDTGRLILPTMKRLGLYNIEGISCGIPTEHPIGAFGRMAEASQGKDTTIGHWEISGIISDTPLPTYPNGFPEEILRPFAQQTGRKVLCNKPYSGTQVIRDYGQEHLNSGGLIIYTSADSVFQIAAHEDLVPPEQLYEYCKIARKLLQGKHSVGRVIARPFTGEYPFTRTANRHDFSLEPPALTLLDQVKQSGRETISVGKIQDIFAGRGITRGERIQNNRDGMEKTIALAKEPFEGLCFVNLVDFDMLYGHRNDVDGYTNALNEFDVQLSELLPLLGPEDILLVTADHGCDPATPSTDHSREYTPLLAYGASVRPGTDLGTRSCFADIGASILAMFDILQKIKGTSFWDLIQV